MKRDRQIAINTHLWLPILVAFVFVLAGIACACEGNRGAAIGFFAATLVPVIVFSMSPIYYAFSKSHIEIVYLWGQKETIKWKSVGSIALYGSWISRGDGTPRYHFAYPHGKKRPFFVSGDISKTIRTQRLIRKYYKGAIL